VSSKDDQQARGIKAGTWWRYLGQEGGMYKVLEDASRSRMKDTDQKDSWRYCVIYRRVDTGDVFVRPVPQFIDKFQQTGLPGNYDGPAR
jgi:hypothetical protein